MKKKLLSGLLSATLAVGTLCTGLAVSATPAHGATTSFSDIKNHWAKDYIIEAAGKGIIAGYPDGTFRPDKPVTRAEFTKMVNNALGNTSSSNSTFSDVPSIEWYYSEVSKAIAAGYVGGYDDGTFLPNNKITRQEAAVMLSRIVPTYNHSVSLSGYGDRNAVSDWAETSLARIVGKKYMGAYDDGKLHPLDSLTRAQAAKIISDIVDKETIVKNALTISKEDEKVSGRIYSNGITINKNVGDGDVTIDNCVVLGTLYVQGGGADENSGDGVVTINNSRIASCQVSKSSGAVQVLAKNETRILNTSVWKEVHLYTSGLNGGLFGTGFDKVTVSGSANTEFSGSFPLVVISGSGAEMSVLSGTITTLNVDAAAKNAKITLETKATVTTTNVNATAEFLGEGTIKTMNANVSGITYVEKPDRINTKSGVTAPKQSDDDGSGIVIDPKRGATKVAVDTDIKLTFDLAIKRYNGKEISNSDIEDLIELHRKTESGTKIDFSASINSTKKVITITPDDELDYDTKYYIIIDADTFKDSKDNANEDYSSYFTTEDEDDDTVSISPRRGATGVSVDTEIKLTFDSKMTRYNGDTLKSSTIESIIELHKKTEGGTEVDFDAEINSAKKVITITPTRNLDYSTKYYVTFAKNKFKDEDGKGNEEFSSYFTTAAQAVATTEISSISASSNENSITVTVTPSQSGDVYGVLVAKNTKAPNATQVIAGQDGNNVAALRVVGKTAVTKNSSKTLPSLTGLDDSTEYTFYAVLKTSSATSSVKSITHATTAPSIPRALLSSLSVDGAISMTPAAFNKNTLEYTVIMPFGSTEATISASPDGDKITVAYPNNNRIVSLNKDEENTFTIGAQGTGTEWTTYNLTIKVAGKTDSRMEILDDNALKTSTNKYAVPPGTATARIQITASDDNAEITCSGFSDKGKGTLEGTVSLNSGENNFTYTVKSNLDEKTTDFSITVSQE